MHLIPLRRFSELNHLSAFKPEAVRTAAADRRIVQRIHTVVVAAAAVQDIRIAAAVAVAVVDRIEIRRRIAAAVDLRIAAVRTSAGLRFDCAVGTKWFPYTRTTSRMSIGRNSRIQSSKIRFHCS